MLRKGPPPSCTCGECRTCKTRAYREKYYKRNREIVIRKNVTAKQKRREVGYVSDEELDRRALAMMGRLQDAR